MAGTASDKRQRLVSAAADLFHRRGLAATSLADVADRAGIAPGNVYYHFRSKTDLVTAVAGEWAQRVETMVTEIERELDPWQRLKCYVARAARHRADYADAGCPIAGINRDLRLSGSDSAAAAAPAFARQVAWLAEQFARGGAASPEADARFLLAALQGSFVIGQAIGDDGVIGDVAARLGDWIDGVRAAA